MKKTCFRNTCSKTSGSLNTFWLWYAALECCSSLFLMSSVLKKTKIENVTACRFLPFILIRKLSTQIVSVGRIMTLSTVVWTFLSVSLPLILLLSQYVVGCCRPCRGDLLPCCTVLCWWRRRVQCQGHLSDKQSRCLTLTNSPAGLGRLPRQSSAATSTQSAETCSCCSKDSVPLPLTTTTSTQRTPTGHLL